MSLRDATQPISHVQCKTRCRGVCAINPQLITAQGRDANLLCCTEEEEDEEDETRASWNAYYRVDTLKEKGMWC